MRWSGCARWSLRSANDRHRSPDDKATELVVGEGERLPVPDEGVSVVPCAV